MKDEDAIRELISTWLAASKDGDLETILPLMSDDVMFLMPGYPPFGKKQFETNSREMATKVQVDALSQVQEIHVEGDLAYAITRLRVTATPRNGDSPTRRGGHTLTIFKKDKGKWHLFRDANLLVSEPT